MADNSISEAQIEERDFRLKELEEEPEIIGLTSRDLRVISTLMYKIPSVTDQEFIVSIEVNLPSGITGRLVRKPRIGFVFAVDVTSII